MKTQTFKVGDMVKLSDRFGLLPYQRDLRYKVTRVGRTLLDVMLVDKMGNIPYLNMEKTLFTHA